jgi:cytochrome c-type biogenesis protein CcmH
MTMVAHVAFVCWLALVAPDPGALEREATAIEAMLIAPCCWSQQVSVHQSAASDEIKQTIRRMLADGKTRRQILDSYVAQYGERILAEPSATGFSAVLYVLPWVFVIGGVGLVITVVRRLRVPARPGALAAEAPSLEESERIDEALRDLD